MVNTQYTLNTNSRQKSITWHKIETDKIKKTKNTEIYCRNTHTISRTKDIFIPKDLTNKTHQELTNDIMVSHHIFLEIEFRERGNILLPTFRYSEQNIPFNRTHMRRRKSDEKNYKQIHKSQKLRVSKLHKMWLVKTSL